MNVNATLDCLLSRRSIRSFRPEAIPEDLLERLLMAGIRAPNAGNQMTYSLLVIDDPAILKAMGAFDNAIAIVSLVDFLRFELWEGKSGVTFYQDKAMSFLIAFWDSVIALHTVCVAAESSGLGSCYVGDILSADYGELLGLPRHVFASGLLFLGWPAETPEQRPRLPYEAVVHRNRYRVPSMDDIDAAYSGQDEEFRRKPATVKEKFAERGIFNAAQALTLGWYTPEILEEDRRGLLRNLERAGFSFE